MLLGSMFIIVSSFVLIVDHEHENKFYRRLFNFGRQLFKVCYFIACALLILVPLAGIVAMLVEIL